KVAGHVLPPSEEVAPVRQGQRFKVGLLLPFAIDRNDSVLAANVGHDARFHEATRIASQYYAGARMAIDSLEKLGLDAEITVLDVGEDPRVWNGVLKQPELKDMDLFIGPFHRTAIDQLARAIPSAHIVCPVPQ